VGGREAQLTATSIPGSSSQTCKSVVKIKEFADAALSALNFAVHFACRHIDKTRRGLGQERLEP